MREDLGIYTDRASGCHSWPQLLRSNAQLNHSHESFVSKVSKTSAVFIDLTVVCKNVWREELMRKFIQVVLCETLATFYSTCCLIDLFNIEKVIYLPDIKTIKEFLQKLLPISVLAGNKSE